jgi:hypothetical protein
MHADEAAYYAEPGVMTALAGDPEMMERLPADPLRRGMLVQGLIVHEFWAGLYGVEIPAPRAAELEIRAASAMLERIVGLDPRPLTQARPPERRIVGNCRHFSVLSCALLRRAGIPARARCGFATYFEPGRYIDHWVLEYRDPALDRWRRVDTQLDEAQQQALALDFDPTDVPAGKFLPAGEAWQLCRSGQVDPERFGILEFWGSWFVRNNVVRDLAALNKIELLPWDGWGLMDSVAELDEETTNRIVDEAAHATTAGDWQQTRQLYTANNQLRVPDHVTSYRAGAVVAVPT